MQKLFIPLIATLLLVADSHGSFTKYLMCVGNMWPNKKFSRFMLLNPLFVAERYFHRTQTTLLV